MEFRFVRVVPKYLNCSTLSNDLLSIFMLWFCPAFWSYATAHNKNKSSLPRTRVKICDAWGSKGDDYKTSCYLVRDAVQFGTYLPIFQGNLFPVSSGYNSKPHTMQLTDTWKNKNKGSEIANGKGNMCPVGLLAAPAPLLSFICTFAVPPWYSSTMKTEAVGSFKALVSICQTTQYHIPRRQYFSRVKKWYTWSRHTLCQIRYL
jgi:hypothetical protein